MFELLKTRINRGNLWGNIVWGIFGLISVIIMARFLVMWGKAANPDYSVLRLTPDYDNTYIAGDTVYFGFLIEDMKMPNPGEMYISFRVYGTDVLYDRSGYVYYYSTMEEPVLLSYEWMIERAQRKLTTDVLFGLDDNILENGSEEIKAYDDRLVIPYTIRFGETVIEESLSVYKNGIREKNIGTGY